MNQAALSGAPEQKINAEELDSLSENVQLSDEELSILQSQTSKQTRE